MMQTTDYPRRQMIEAALKRQPDAIVATTIRLWEQLAPELISIIGEGGFNSLYSRSVRLAGAKHPWMPKNGKPPVPDQRFAELHACLQAQDAAQAGHGSRALFNIFLDLLGSLIGEALTTHLLHSAWRQEAFEIPAKDFPT
ncbi:MAG: hypothetical protein JWR68_1209 [Polaromonas sp.]|nr:hypothetical protein [Polaromonas sp.]